jgi:hypothetical protein
MALSLLSLHLPFGIPEIICEYSKDLGKIASICIYHRDCGQQTEIVLYFDTYFFSLLRYRTSVEIAIVKTPQNSEQTSKRYQYIPNKNANGKCIQSNKVSLLTGKVHQDDNDPLSEIIEKGWAETIESELGEAGVPMYIRDPLMSVFACVKLKKKKIDKVYEELLSMGIVCQYEWHIGQDF